MLCLAAYPAVRLTEVLVNEYCCKAKSSADNIDIF